MGEKYPRVASFFFRAKDAADEAKKVLTMRRALALTDEEQARILELLDTDHDCNENPLSRSASTKLNGGR